MGLYRRHPPFGRVLKRGGGRPRRSTGPRPLVAIFAKAPFAGEVKTRLTPVLRAREAAELAEALLLDTVEVVERAGLDAVVAFAPAAGRRAFEQLLGPRRRLIPQGGGDLGTRLDRIMERLAGERRGSVVAIGTDCPAVDGDHLRAAVQALGQRDVVLGPALDGGFYLLGLRRHQPELFREVPWSTDATLTTVEARARSAGLTVTRLAAARDLDSPEDLYAWYAAAREAGLQETYPRTWSVLHAALPPRRLAALEAVVRGDPER